MITPNVPPRIAVVGVSSLIGEAVLDELRARKFSYTSLHALDDERNIGRPLAAEENEDETGDGNRKGKTPQVIPVSAFDFAGADLVIFCGRSALAEQFAEAAAATAWVIDCSAAFRSRGDVPLIVADVNGGAVAGGGSHGLIALPGSASVALATALAPLHAVAGLARVEVATYQAVSGSGRGAMDELAGETVAMLSGKKPRGRAFGRQIAFNVIPQVDALEVDGLTREERRLWHETGRVLGWPGLAINATAVRVPVFFGHSWRYTPPSSGPSRRKRRSPPSRGPTASRSSTSIRPRNSPLRPPSPRRLTRSTWGGCGPTRPVTKL